MPATASLGAILAMGRHGRRIVSHLLILGIAVKGDGGLLFGLAVAAFVGSLVVPCCAGRRFRVVGRHFELA